MGILISVVVSLLLTIKDATVMRFRILGRDLITRTWEPIDTKKTKSEEVAREIEEESPDALIIVEIRVTQFCDWRWFERKIAAIRNFVLSFSRIQKVILRPSEKERIPEWFHFIWEMSIKSMSQLYRS
ncbi:hypothetical protein PGT21_016886 [Puccinia graminis f. sp. tritici]|uniref:Uncharacterized protein n=1 Tax=Puccinia graminis f. sp. tritici TaxID=56615 RepID=A0A5B0PXS6_PUCGR|nr:hypothetical protein PGT21_016886 [Puccinia graminis f. sp. tritici]